MERRKFLSFTASAFAFAMIPNSLKADDYRKLKPKVWTATKVDEAIKNLYGTSQLIEEGVTIKAAKVASSGAKVKIKFSTNIPSKTVALFQDANPESAVAVFTVNKYDLMDYQVNIKMGQSGVITVVAEGLDGKLYAAKHTMEVAAGGCEG